MDNAQLIQLLDSSIDLNANAKWIGLYLTRYLAPFFGDDLEVEITLPASVWNTGSPLEGLHDRISQLQEQYEQRWQQFKGVA